MEKSSPPPAPLPSPLSSGSLSELARLFLRLGVTAFGGPAAHIALMKHEVVTVRNWLTEAEFLDLLGVTNLIPGPNSTELAIHIDYMRGRWAGLLLAGICFILPAALIVSFFAWLYVRFGSLPAVAGILYGVKPVVIAVVIQAIGGLLKPAVKNRFLAALGAGAILLTFLGVDELALLFGAGALAGVMKWSAPEQRKNGVRPLFVLLAAASTMALLPSLLLHLPLPAAAASWGRLPFGTAPLLLFFLKVGATLYGSGYVLLAFLRDGLVNRWRWLSGAQLLDATAVGQVTPGPVFTTATFIGSILGGPCGALAATVGIFLPSFIFVAISGPLAPRLRKSPLTGAFLDGVNVAALALMVSVTYQLGHDALRDPLTIAIALLSAFLLLRFRVNSAWLLLGAAVVGFLATAMLPAFFRG